MLRLALPVVAGELGWMSMGVVDILMVAPLGPAAIGATGVGNSLHFTLATFGMGLLLGLDTLVSQAYGAGRPADCHRWLVHGIALALLALAPLMLLNGLVLVTIPHAGFHPEVTPPLLDYYSVLLWSTVPLMFYAVFRRYLLGIHHVTPIMFALVSANAVNAIGNWILIHGNLGFPALGVAGAAWATLLSRCYLVVVLLAATLRRDRWTWNDVRAMRHAIERAWLRRLFHLSFPAASQITLEVGVFGATTALAGMVDPISAAAHQIAMNFAAVTFMIPLGLSSAGAVRVAHAMGAADPQRAAGAGWAAIVLGTIFMTAMAVIFVTIPRTLIGWFSPDEAVRSLGASLLMIGAIFQLFDGLQGVATGVLRGIGDTRSPMLINFVAHWLFGLPLGYALCFTMGYGVAGLWIGLSAGLIVVGLLLVTLWSRRIHAHQQGQGLGV